VKPLHAASCRPGIHSVEGFTPHVLRWVLEIPPRAISHRLVHGHEQTFHVVLTPEGDYLIEMLSVFVRSAGRAQRARRGSGVAWSTQLKRKRQAEDRLRVESLCVGHCEHLTGPVGLAMISGGRGIRLAERVACRPDQRITMMFVSRYPDGCVLDVVVRGLLYRGRHEAI